MRQRKRPDQQKNESSQADKAESDENLRKLIMNQFVMRNGLPVGPMQFGIAEPRMKDRVCRHIAKAVKTIAKSLDPEGLLLERAPGGQLLLNTLQRVEQRICVDDQ